MRGPLPRLAIAPLELQMEQTKLDRYDELLARIMRTYMLIEELGREPHTPNHEVAIRALREAQAGVFLDLEELEAISHN